MAYANTIRVTSKDHGGEEIVINERDFDEAKHTRVGAEAEGAPAAPVDPEPHKPTGQGAIERNLPPAGVQTPSQWMGPEGGGILHGIAEQQEREARIPADQSLVRERLKAGEAVPPALGAEHVQEGVEAYDPAELRPEEGPGFAPAVEPVEDEAEQGKGKGRKRK